MQRNTTAEEGWPRKGTEGTKRNLFEGSPLKDLLRLLCIFAAKQSGSSWRRRIAGDQSLAAQHCPKLFWNGRSEGVRILGDLGRRTRAAQDCSHCRMMRRELQRRCLQRHVVLSADGAQAPCPFDPFG